MLCAVAIMPVLGAHAWAQQTETKGTAGKPPGSEDDASWSVVLIPGAPGERSEQLPPAWSQREIEQARARCTALLRGLNLVAVPAEPIREGAACGAPAPMQLISIGSNPPVVFSPNTLLTCDMIAALHKWVQGDIQPLARKHLGVPVVGVNVMSSFSCRTAYGRAGARLSEHGRVNALDLGSFLTAQGETAQVVADWGPVMGHVVAKVDAAQAETVKQQAEAAAAARKTKAPEKVLAQKAPEAPRVAAPSTIKTIQATSMPIGIPGITIGGTQPAGLSTGLGFGPPNHLGGPKEKDAALPEAPSAKAAFLHDIHKAACKIFTTVLGPKANKYHRNHFHLDLAERTSPSICE